MKTKILLFLTICLSLSSCDDFLVEKPLDKLTSETFYSTDQNLDQGIYGVYSSVLYYWKDSRGPGASIYTVGEVRSDDIALPTDGANYSTLLPYDTYNYNASDNAIMAVWRDLYKGISRANVAIEKVTPIVPGNGVTELKKNTVLAEAYALRGFIYYHLVRYWGDVPLMLSSVQSTNAPNLNPARETAAKVYEQIIKDMKTSIGEGEDPKVKLPVSTGGTNSARLSLGAGYGLLAEVYLTTKDWANAALYARKAMDLNLYGLWPNYKDGFSMVNKGKVVPTDSKGRKNRIDGIFEMQFYQEIDPGTPVTITSSPRGKFVSDFVTPNRAGDGNYCATKSLYDLFDATDARRATIFQTQFKDQAGKLQNYPATPGITGGKYMTKYTLEGQPLAVWGLSGNQIAVLRYSDILLAYAEAVNEIGGPTVEAYAAINEVRQRAGLIDLAGLDQTSFRDAVVQERRKEFTFECRRFFDLQRTGKVVSEMAKVGITVDPNKILLPIPQTELDNNSNNEGFLQNPGYN